MNDNQIPKSIQLEDIALALGLSKSTVSRAISGKGRIGDATRIRVLDYIEEHDYRPNMIAKSLAKSQTFNVGVVLPEDAVLTEIPFFQTCLMGICEACTHRDYDVVITTVTETDISYLHRIIRNRKVDGLILTRALVNDYSALFLKQVGIPFVLIGSSPDDSIVQIDTDHTRACCELTSSMFITTSPRIGLLLGSLDHTVNQSRYQGYRQAYMERYGILDDSIVHLDLSNKAMIQQAIDALLASKVDGIVCGDDYICSRALSRLYHNNIAIPQQIMIASFYNSAFLENHNPPITAIDINVKALGVIAGETLLDVIDQKEVAKKTLSGYSIVERKSTKR